MTNALIGALLGTVGLLAVLKGLLIALNAWKREANLQNEADKRAKLWAKGTGTGRH